MFKAFSRQFDAEPKFKIGESVVTKYDIWNNNGVFVRGSILRVTSVHRGTYCEGIRYVVEDSCGNMSGLVNEDLFEIPVSKKRRRRFFSKAGKSDN